MRKTIDFKFPNGKIIELRYLQNNKKKFVARAPSPNFWGFKKIHIDALFFEFSYKEQASIIHHELWHYHNNSKFEIKCRIKKPWLLLFFFINKPILHAQEFNADMYALKMTNKDYTLKMLKRLKRMIEIGQLPASHEKTHPPINERIKRIRDLNKKV